MLPNHAASAACICNAGGLGPSVCSDVVREQLGLVGQVFLDLAVIVNGFGETGGGQLAGKMASWSGPGAAGLLGYDARV